jgi:hypothetical protein
METYSFLSIAYGALFNVILKHFFFGGIATHFLGIVKWMINMPTKNHITYKDLQYDMVWTLIKYLNHNVDI